ncbi:DMT family transporter [Sporobolomyces salmoneus]|uniref:DMT family transporter n=1 Tax=Sporobolomyces salmoneus TaxID=183962 RepID=UPI00317D7B07
MFTGMDYNKPFLVTWICTSTFSLYLIRPGLRYLRNRRKGREGDRDRDGGDSIRSVSVRSVVVAPTSKNDQHLTAFTPTQFIEINGNPHRPDALSHRRDTSRSLSRARPSRTDMGRHVPILPVDPPLSTRETAKLALAFCGLWFAANWAMNAALGYTSVSSTTILTSMSGFFTLAAGAAIGVESFTAGKFVAVVLSILGVAVVSLNDSHVALPPTIPSPPLDPSHPPPPFSHPAFSHPLLGDFLALVSAVAYAAYVLLLKVQIRSEARVSMTLFFGFVGLWNILFMWPIGVLLHLTGVERFEVPKGGELWASIMINASITFVSDALYLRSMLLTSPLAVTLGLSLTIPLAIAGDLYRSAPVSLFSFLGGLLVLGSFVGNGMMDLREAEEKGAGLVAVVENGGAGDEEEGGNETERLLSREGSERDYRASESDEEEGTRRDRRR